MPAVPRPPGEILQTSQGGAGRRRRLPALRVPQTGGVRLPLSAMPGGPGYRTRAEAPGRHRRRRDRRVRRTAGARPQGEQSRLRDLALERQTEAAGVRGILVAPARPRTEIRADVAAVARRQWMAVEPPLARHSRSARTTPQSLRFDRTRRSQKPRRVAGGQGRRSRRRSEPLTARHTPRRCCSGWRPRLPPGRRCPPCRQCPRAAPLRAPSLPVRRAHPIRVTGAQSAAGSPSRSLAI